MAEKWYDSFLAELLREFGIEWWFHRKGRTSAGGTTTTGAPASSQGPKSLLEWVQALPAKYRRELKGLPPEELEALLKLKQEEREAALIARFGMPPSLSESLRETAEGAKEKIRRLEEKIQSSPETMARVEAAREKIGRLNRWLGKRP